MLLVCELHFGEQGSGGIPGLQLRGPQCHPLKQIQPVMPVGTAFCSVGWLAGEQTYRGPSLLRPGTKHEGKSACSQGAVETPRTGARGFWCFQKCVSGGHSVLGPLVTWGLLNTQIPGP